MTLTLVVRAKRSLCALTLALVAAARLSAQPAGAAPTASPYAAQLSFAYETQGQLESARAVLMAVYGARPALYSPCVRLAWLNLRLQNYQEAATLYERAKQLPDALPEANSGLAMALTGAGYASLANGYLANARASFDNALAADSANVGAREGVTLVGSTRQFTPEIWYGTLAADHNGSTAHVLYLQLPKQFTPRFSARVAVRAVTSPTALGTTESFFGEQKEIFGGVAYDIGRSTVQAVAFLLSTTASNAPGGAVGWRYGGRSGINAMAAVMSRFGANNLQIAPMVYHYFPQGLYLSAGARITADSNLVNPSGLVEGAFHRSAFDLDVRGHVGKERSAMSLAGPTILSFSAQTASGGSVTASYRLGQSFQLFTQAQYERMATPSLNGAWYRSFALGARFMLVDNNSNRN